MRGTTKPFWTAVAVIVAASCDGTEADLGAEGIGVQLRSVSDCPEGYNIIEGTNGDDNLRGTSGNDCILGYDGNDSDPRPQG